MSSTTHTLIMAIKVNNTESEQMILEKTEVSKKSSSTREETFVLKGSTYSIRYPKASDMLVLERTFEENAATTPFAQALYMVERLCDDEELTFEYLMDLYLDELTPILELFNKLMPAG